MSSALPESGLLGAFATASISRRLPAVLRTSVILTRAHLVLAPAADAFGPSRSK
jgi:hypothetical protein